MADAMQRMRSRANEWKIDRERVGVIGASASGHLAATPGAFCLAPRWANGREKSVTSDFVLKEQRYLRVLTEIDCYSATIGP